MKLSSFLASVILCVYVFLTPAPLPASPDEMIWCLWSSDIRGMVELFFWTSSTSRKSWQRGEREMLRHTQAADISDTTGPRGRQDFKVLGRPHGKITIPKCQFYEESQVSSGLDSCITSIFIIITPIFTDNGPCTRHISSHLTINSPHPHGSPIRWLLLFPFYR